jgi:O-antigen/teichoic acid export membrane protein
MISLWFTAIVAVNSNAIVQISLSKQWAAAAPLLTVTAWAIPAGALDMVAYILCMALGISTSFVRSAVLNLIFFLPAVLIVRHLGGGMVALAVCWSASRYLIALATLQAARRKLEFGLRDIGRPVAAIAGAMAASIGVMYAIRTVMHARLPVQFVVESVAGTLVYFAAVWVLEPGTVRDTWRMARGRSAVESRQGLDPIVVATTQNPDGEEGTLWPAADTPPETIEIKGGRP